MPRLPYYVLAVLLSSCALACGSAPCPAAAPAAPAVAVDETAAIRDRVRALLASYAGNDVEAVLRLCDLDQIAIYGSDVSEVARGADAVRQMMADDFKLWGSAQFGEPRELEVRQGGDLATAFFNVPFRAGGQKELVVRVATVWHKEGGAWRLTESSNTVPTVGSSARELLHH